MARGATVTWPCVPPDVARTALNGAIGWRLSLLAHCRIPRIPLSPLPVCSLHSPLLGRAHPFLRRLINHFQFRPALQPPTLEYNCSRNNSDSRLIEDARFARRGPETKTLKNWNDGKGIDLRTVLVFIARRIKRQGRKMTNRNMKQDWQGEVLMFTLIGRVCRRRMFSVVFWSVVRKSVNPFQHWSQPRQAFQTMLHQCLYQFLLLNVLSNALSRREYEDRFGEGRSQC